MLNKGTISQAVNVDIAVSSEMATSLVEWRNMYLNQADWLTTNVYSLGLPAAIAAEIARAVTIEMEVEISGSARADFLNENMQRVVDRLRDEVEVGCALGGLIIKPYPKDDRLSYNYVGADSFYPVDFDDDGNIISCIFVDTTQIKNQYFTRLEFHQMIDGGYQIINKAYKSTSKETLGGEVPLDSIPAWADLEPEAFITNIEKPLFSYFRYPISNNIDMDSPLGISCYSKAQNGKVQLIKQADEMWSGLMWEFESGERAMYVDTTAFPRGSDDKPILPKAKQRLYRPLNQTGNIGDKNQLYDDWSPAFREASYESGLNDILKRIEFNCGLAYGTLSDPQYIDKTATEIKSAKQRSYATILDTQKSLKACLENLLYASDVWATLYNLSPRGNYEAAFKWDDSIVTDAELKREQGRQDVDRKLMARYEYRMQEYGETEEQAKAAIAEIDAETQSNLDVFGLTESV